MPAERFYTEQPAGPQGKEGRVAGGALVRGSPAAPQAAGRRMRGAGRRVVNGAFCLPEFGAGGRARRRGGADRGGADGRACEVGGERKWRRRRRRPGAASAGFARAVGNG